MDAGPYRARVHVTLSITIIGLALSAACQREEKKAEQPASRPIPKAGPLSSPKTTNQIGFPAAATQAAIPPDNAQTPAKIALGEKLFFDGRLSVDGTVACSTCHNPAHAFTDGRPEGVST